MQKTIPVTFCSICDVYANLLSLKKLPRQQDLIQAILPDFVGNIVCGSNRSNLFFNAATADSKNADTLFRSIGAVMAPGNQTDYSYENSPWRKTVHQNWSGLLESVEDGTLEKAVRDLVRKWDKDTQFQVRERLEELLQGKSRERTLEVLTCLTLISATALYWLPERWERPRNIGCDETSLKIQVQILPPPKKESRVGEQMERLRAANDKNAEETLLSIQQGRITDISEICKKCLSILDVFPQVSPGFRGEAAYYIYLKSNEGKFVLPQGKTPRQYLDLAHNCGYKNATEEWQKLRKFALRYDPAPAQSGSSGICYVNSDDERTRLLLKTVPRGWDVQTFEDSPGFLPGRGRKYLFLREDYRQNLKDTLAVLQQIKDCRPAEDAYPAEIYLRGRTEVCAPLIDTALSHMDDIVVPVYVLDDDKDAAQQLLSRHPLFYPVRNLLSENTITQLNYYIREQDKLHLNFLVIGDTECAAWLAREAFWMMTFPADFRIQPRIFLCGPNALQMEDRLRGSFPGMFDGDSPIFRCIRAEYGSPEFYNSLAAAVSGETEYGYFAIDTGSDEDNLTLAIRLRERLIRSRVQSPAFLKNHQMPELPVIAFRCQDPDIALLSRSMVVEMEAYGNQWFNNHSLIPFGSADFRYHWDRLDGGLTEAMARRVHLQYCGALKPGIRKKQEAMVSYYRHQYNRDSSRAVAVAIAYRLFQWQRYVSLLPTDWNILEEDGILNATQMDTIAKKLEDFLLKKEAVPARDALTLWEKERWNRFMLSRGWLSATGEEAVSYIKAGNPRPGLNIARLHPCLIPFDGLEALEKTLYDEFSMEKNFRDSDKSSITATHLLIQSQSLEPALEKDR